MKMQRVAVALAAINLVLLFLIVLHAGSTPAQTISPILLGRAVAGSWCAEQKAAALAEIVAATLTVSIARATG